MRQLTNIFRRVYRIFAHAWFQHREVFWHIETTHGIYMLFKTICDEYHLIPDDNYTIPPEAEGSRTESESPTHPTPTEANSQHLPIGVQILRKDTVVPMTQNGLEATDSSSPPKEPTPAATARRHRHTPSTGSHVTTITESAEDEEDVPPVPPLPNTTAAKSSNTTTPGISSPERSAREALGRLDLSDTTSSPFASQPENPTPTTASVADPLAAAGSSITYTPSTASTDSSTSTTAAEAAKTKLAETTKLDTSPATVASPAKSLADQERRSSGFESEVRSPGGGSVRTAGPDLLNAILGHMDDKEREELQAAQASGTTDDGVEDDGGESADETVLFVGEDELGEHNKASTEQAERLREEVKWIIWLVTRPKKRRRRW
jgi:hypothetical protein